MKPDVIRTNARRLSLLLNTQRGTPDGSPERKALARMHTLAEQRSTKRYRKAIGRVFSSATDALVEKLSELPRFKTPGLIKNSASGASLDFLFDTDAFSQDIIGALRPVAKGTLNTAGQQLYDELGVVDEAFTMAPPDVKQFLADRENLLSDVGENVWGNIKTQLQEGYDNGESLAQLTQRAQRAMDEEEAARAEVIAQTETHAAFGYSRQKAMKRQGVEKKQWLISHSPLIKEHRLEHLMADGQVRGIDEPFDIGGEKILYPGAPGTSAANAINCHCHLLPYFDEEPTVKEEAA